MLVSIHSAHANTKNVQIFFSRKKAQVADDEAIEEFKGHDEPISIVKPLLFFKRQIRILLKELPNNVPVHIEKIQLNKDNEKDNAFRVTLPLTAYDKLPSTLYKDETVPYDDEESKLVDAFSKTAPGKWLIHTKCEPKTKNEQKQETSNKSSRSQKKEDQNNSDDEETSGKKTKRKPETEHESVESKKKQKKDDASVLPSSSSDSD